jgi:tetratricopeptide (TPR) repeat protein
MPEGVKANSPIVERREIRVFISSTFRDMQGERDYLVKGIFPQLRKLCESRGVTWGEVDLRWGVTDEQAADGKVLPICLEEIQRCRPYFIGLLGERYGWIPEALPADLLEREPWLNEHLHGKTSVTELEILHGVLRNPRMSGRAYFYFRDPAFLNSIPEKDRKDFTAENAKDAEKLRNLKENIRRSGSPVHENYPDPNVLGELVLADLTKVINDLFPEDSQPDPLDQEAARNEAYARSRRLAFVGRDDLLCRLDEHAAKSGKPLVLTGESGCGKSALLAEWVNRWRENHPDDLIVQHYIGRTPDSADWQGLVRRMLGELKRAFAIPDDIPLQPYALRGALNDWTVKAAGSRRVVLVLDALDQLAEDSAARQLGWLPAIFPANFLVIVSSSPAESLDALRKRGWQELKVPLFERADIAPAARAYFKIFSKTPPKDIVAKLESTPAACNALYLRAVLDELRQFGKHEELEAKAADYLSTRDPKELYERILTRWEMDFGEDLVRQSLSLIRAARHGLSEAEILDLLGKQSEPREPLPRAKWTPFYFAAESSLVLQSGLLGLAHGFVFESVTTRYMQNNDAACRAHEAIADYFARQPLLFRFQDEKQNREISPFFIGDVALDSVDHVAPRPYNRRKLEEQPWQLRVTREWRKLSLLLSDLLFFQADWDYCHEDVETFWRELHGQGGLSMPRAYEGVIRNPEKYATRLLWAIGRLLSETHFPREAVPVQQCLIGRTKDVRLANILAVSNLAQTLSQLDETDQALQMLNKVRQEMTQSGISFAIAPLLFELGRIHYEKQSFSEAIRHLREASLICRTGMRSTELLGKILLYRGLAHGRIGEMDASVRLAAQAVTELRRGDSRKDLAWGLAMNGMILKTVDEGAAAYDAWQEAKNIYEELNDRLASDNLSRQLSALSINKRKEVT